MALLDNSKVLLLGAVDRVAGFGVAKRRSARLARLRLRLWFRRILRDVVRVGGLRSRFGSVDGDRRNGGDVRGIGFGRCRASLVDGGWVGVMGAGDGYVHV